MRVPDAAMIWVEEFVTVAERLLTVPVYTGAKVDACAEVHAMMKMRDRIILRIDSPLVELGFTCQRGRSCFGLALSPFFSTQRRVGGREGLEPV